MKAVVLSDRLGYYDENGVVQRAFLGDEVELSKEDFDRHEAAGAVAKAGSKEAKAAAGGSGEEPESAYPKTHDELDALAEANDFEWPDGVKNVAEKHAALTDAGIEAPSE